ncbi:extracellular solute-binding protein [Eubacteriales bacterium OttesenSCG-928-A19]|nr:extracellular solute-binding protein [Eubacteriales bacterium OttesenSCG-928-A19]
MKKIVAFLVVVTMLLSLASISLAQDPPTALSIVNRVEATYQLDNNPVLEAIEQAANVKLDIELPPINNYTDRLNIIMASGEMPDIVHVQNMNDSYFKWAEEGLLIPLDDYLDQMPNVMANTTAEQLQAGLVTSTGKLHALPRPHAENSHSGMIREDWLENLGLSVPRTLDEFTAVLKAFTFDDPDGNGKNDTYGMSLTDVNDYLANNISIFKSAFQVRNAFMPDDEGNVTIMQDQEAYLEMMDYFREMYALGVIDPEWYTNQGYAEWDKFKFGQIGVVSMSIKPVSLYSTDIYTGTKSAFPEASFALIIPLTKGDSYKSYLGTSVSTWGGFAISKNCTDIDGALRFIDWAYSEEGRTMMNIGVQGITYDSFETTDGVLARIVYTGDQRKDFQRYVSKYMSFITAIDGLRLLAEGETPEEQEAYVQAEIDYKENVDLYYLPSMNVLVSYAEVRKEFPELPDKLNEYCAKYIIGNIDREEFATFVQDVYVKANEPVIAEMQDYYNENLKTD